MTLNPCTDKNESYNRITKVFFTVWKFVWCVSNSDHFCGKIPALWKIANWAVVPTIRSTATPWWNLQPTVTFKGVYTQRARTPSAPAISFESLGMWRPFCSEVENLWRMSSMWSLICLQTSSLAFQNCNFERIRKKKVNLSMRDFTLQQWMLRRV